MKNYNYSGEWLDGIGGKIWKSFRLDINTHAQGLVKEFYKTSEKLVLNWRGRVAAELDDQLPESGWHKLRPDVNKKFPYKNTGKQLDELDAGVTFKTSGAGNFNINAWGEIGVPYAEFTSQGFRHRADGDPVGWLGWKDDVFKGTRGFYSLDEVFELLVLEREGFRR